ncbi:MAG: sialidase family protein [Longimicrobiales bacterium]
MAIPEVELGMRRAVTGLAVTLLAAGCADSGSVDVPIVREIVSPAGEGSGEPFVGRAPDGRVLMSWLEAQPDSMFALRLAAWDGVAWSDPATVTVGSDLFVNWADFPSVHALADGRLAAHWLRRSGAGRYAYDVNLAFSSDGGETWSEPITPHRDGTPTEHGFVSLFDAPDGGLGAVWLDGRNFAGESESGGEHGGGADMTLRYARILSDGSLADEHVLDDRTCECCQTSAALTADGPVVVYRDRSPAEVRNIAVQRLGPNGWTQPAPLHDDAWQVPGCPVNGPAVDAIGRRVVVAWFTAPGDTARVHVAFSDDGGASFGAPIRADDGDPTGRVDVQVRADGTALLSWLERTEEAAEVRVRRVMANGHLGPAATVVESTPARASGFPRMAPIGDDLLIAWTDPATTRVRVAVLTAGF